MRISKDIKRVILTFIFIFLILIIEIALGRLVKPVFNMYSTYFMHDLEEIEAKKEQVELVFLGASGEYLTYVPEIFEEKLNMNCVINAASSAQPTCAAYYQLKNLIERFHPSNVVIGLAWNELAIFNLQGKLIVYDRLTGLTKLQYAIECFDKEERLYTFYSYRYRDNISKIASLHKQKQYLIQTDYKSEVSNDEYYADTGFIYSYKSCKDGNISCVGWGEFEFSEKTIREENLAYLDACVDLCKKNNINLYLVSSPISMAQIYNIKNYQGATDFYQKYAKKNGLVYHNLNYLKYREKSIPDSVMRDESHLNGEGASIVSEIYAEILEKDIAGNNTNDYFYENLNQLKKDVNRIVTVEAEITVENDHIHIETRSLHNEETIPFYQIEISEDNDNFNVLAGWTKDNVFDIDIPDEGEFSLKVKAKAGNEGEVEAFQVYNYEEISGK